eukprot:scaffold16872_cov121-Isochrysis_galbana.AAC.1
MSSVVWRLLAPLSALGAQQRAARAHFKSFYSITFRRSRALEYSPPRDYSARPVYSLHDY